MEKSDGQGEIEMKKVEPLSPWPPPPPPDPKLHIKIVKGGCSPVAFAVFAPVIILFVIAVVRLVQLWATKP